MVATLFQNNILLGERFVLLLVFQLQLAIIEFENLYIGGVATNWARTKIKVFKLKLPGQQSVTDTSSLQCRIWQPTPYRCYR